VAALIPASTLGALLTPVLPFVVPLSEVSLARIWGLGARRVGKFTAAVRILPQSRAVDGAGWDGNKSSLLVGHRSSAEKLWIKRGQAPNRHWVVSLVTGILIAVLIAAGAFILLVSQRWPEHVSKQPQGMVGKPGLRY